MGSLILIDNTSLYSSEIFDYSEIPACYMDDYSVLGFTVDRYDDSLKLLEQAGYRLESRRIGAVVFFDGIDAILRLYTLLVENGINTEYRDIAETFYQS